MYLQILDITKKRLCLTPRTCGGNYHYCYYYCLLLPIPITGNRHKLKGPPEEAGTKETEEKGRCAVINPGSDKH